MTSNRDAGVRCERHIGEVFAPRCYDCQALAAEEQPAIFPSTEPSPSAAQRQGGVSGVAELRDRTRAAERAERRYRRALVAIHNHLEHLRAGAGPQPEIRAIRARTLHALNPATVSRARLVQFDDCGSPAIVDREDQDR